MGIFGFGKKKKEQSTCTCGGSNNTSYEYKGRVKILGGGCAKCNQLEEATVQALAELKMDTNIEHIKDFGQIASYGVMVTPALVFDGKVVSSGKVLTKQEVIAILQKVNG